jgi:flagellar M-ring protein FliF
MAIVEGKYAQLWSRLGVPARAGLIAGVVLILAAAIGLAVWSSGSDYQVLFSQLAEADAATVVEQLKRQKIPYRLAEGGTTVKVPAEQVYETRLALVSSGMPLSGGVGFELFDRQGMGATEQSQRVTYQRALQGELARTIGALNNVKYARVHLVLPESTVFKRDREDPRASVALVLKPGAVLSREEVTGIQRLVAASVAGLDAAKVVITDQRGVTLSGAGDTETGSGGSEARLGVKRDIEGYVARKIVALLDRAYGPGQALVSVDVALNFDEIKSTIQDVVPLHGAGNGAEGAVLRRRQVEMGSTASDVVASETGAAASNKAPTSTTEVEYEFGRRIEQVIAAPGSITRLSVGVVVPGALDEAKRERIVDLVRVAAGANMARGDAIVVEPLDDFATAGATARSLPATADATEAAPVVVPKSVSVGFPPGLRAPVVVGSLLAIALLLGLLVGRAVSRRNKALSYSERRQLLLELETALNTRSSYSIGSEV